MRACTRQPAGVAVADPVFAPAYLLYCTGAGMVSAPRGVPPTIKSSVFNGIVPGPEGAYLSGGDPGGGTIVGPRFASGLTSFMGNKPFTVFVRMPIVVTAETLNVGNIFQAGSTSYGFLLRYRRNASTTWLGLSLIENYGYGRGASFTFTQSQPWASYFFIYDGSTMKMYQNTVELAATTANVSNISYSYPLIVLNDIASYGSIGAFSMLGLFTYPMNGSQRAILSSNPNALLQEKSWLYTGMGSGSWTPLEVAG